MIEVAQLPHDVRGFVHKRLLGAATSFVTSGFNPLAAASSFIAPRPPPRPVAPRVRTARVTVVSAQQKDLGRSFKFAPEARVPSGGILSRLRGRFLPSVPLGITRCEAPLVPDVDGRCVFPGSPADISVGGAVTVGVGEALMGRYGAALRPGQMSIARAVCLRGMVLGNDRLCYNKPFPNKQRMWPRGRKPLLTGGEMRAISIAATAGRRVERTTQRLQEIGFIKKPVVRKRSKKKC